MKPNEKYLKEKAGVSKRRQNKLETKYNREKTIDIVYENEEKTACGIQRKFLFPYFGYYFFVIA